MQHVKVDGEAAMLRLDQILRANELSLSLMAALPALGACWAALVAAVRCGTGYVCARGRHGCEKAGWVFSNPTVSVSFTLPWWLGIQVWDGECTALRLCAGKAARPWGACMLV